MFINEYYVNMLFFYFLNNQPTCGLQFPDKVQPIRGFCLLAMYYEGDNESDQHDDVRILLGQRKIAASNQ